MENRITNNNAEANETTEAVKAEAIPTAEAEATPVAEAEIVGKEVGPNPAIDYLVEHGVDTTKALLISERLGVSSVEDLAMCEEADLVKAGMKTIPARKLLSGLTAAKKPAAPVAPAPAMTLATGFENILPPAPDDESWLKNLKAGGVLKVSTESYVSAIRVAFAEQAGMLDLPEKLAKAMENYADESDESVPAEFFSLRKQITRRNYGEIFDAIEGLNGSFITESRRKEFLRRVRVELLPAIHESFTALNGWYEAVRATNSDPTMLLTALAGAMNGTGAINTAVMPPFDAVADASEALKDAINRVFRGTGAITASAMAFEIQQISNVLENPDLPRMLGVANRELMLKKLSANISPNYIRQEANMVRYVLSFVNFTEKAEPGSEIRGPISCLTFDAESV